MTYCVGLKIDRGLVFMSDTRTNAGMDSISTFRKMHVWEDPGERVIVLMSAGNLATTQAVVSLLDERTKVVTDRHAALLETPSMYQTVRLVGDTVDIAKSNGATVTGDYDLLMWLAKKGVEKLNPMNTGGTVDLGGFSVSMVRADHSSGSNEGDTSVYLGNPHGLIVKSNGEPAVWHLGDTDIFSDMALIAEIHEPKVAIVPIGGHSISSILLR